MWRGKRDASGAWKDLARLKVSRDVVDNLADPTDQRTLKFLRGASDFFDEVATNQFELERNWDTEIIDDLIQSGRVCWTEELRSKSCRLRPLLQGGFGIACEVGVELTETEGPGSPATFAAFVKLGLATGADEQRLTNDEIVALSRDGIVLTHDALHLVKNPDAIPVWHGCQENPDAQVDNQERENFLEKLSTLGGIVDVRLPESWEVTEQTSITPTGELRLKKNDYQKDFYGEVFITYDDVKYHFSDRRLNTYDPDTQRWFRRNTDAEKDLIDAIENLPVDFQKGEALVSWDLKFHQDRLLEAIEFLADKNWTVLLEGQPIRTPSHVSIAVESGQDWFDVSAEVKFEGQSIPLPVLLTAIKEKQHFIKLADGSRGQLPCLLYTSPSPRDRG